MKTNLDLMRAVAILLVVFDHNLIAFNHPNFRSYNLLWMGVFGVYLFFVHTCLVLMWSLERRPHTLDFYIRRVFRIYPLAIVFMSIMMIFHIGLNGVRLDAAAVLSNLLLVQNLWQHGTVSGILWSLPLELQMYLVLPMLFAFAYRDRTRWTLIGLWLLSVGIARVTFEAPRGNDFITVIPHFLPGVIAFVGFNKVRPKLPAWTFILFLFLLLFWFELSAGVERGWFACLALGLALPYFRQITNRTLIRGSHEIAKYSYSIYLFHIPAIMLAMHFSGLPALAKLALEFASIAVFSFVGYHLIESPMISVGSRIAARVERRVDRAEKHDPLLI